MRGKCAAPAPLSRLAGSQRSEAVCRRYKRGEASSVTTLVVDGGMSAMM